LEAKEMPALVLEEKINDVFFNSQENCDEFEFLLSPLEPVEMVPLVLVVEASVGKNVEKREIRTVSFLYFHSNSDGC